MLRGLTPQIRPSRTGHVLDRQAAASTIVRALASLKREPVGLPVRVDRPKVTADDLTVAVRPRSRQRCPRRSSSRSGRRAGIYGRGASPASSSCLRMGAATCASAAPVRRGGSRRLRSASTRSPWTPTGRSARAASASFLTVPATCSTSRVAPRSLLRAALVTAPELRQAKLIVERADADRSTAEAEAMNISGLVASYQTFYGGEPNRIHNVQLVSHLVDKHVIAPGETFSFNGATGARTADKGFREAPVIINGELQTGLGGGVCQVSTTVFNAAYEAGLPIVSRTNHALYISHYPQGRDATVNYPDLDLKFRNDTGHWLLLRTWVGSSSLTVALYGTPVHRRVLSETMPLVVRGRPPTKKVPDPTLFVGEKEVEETGEPPRSTSVRRKVYDAEGELLYDTVFYSSYRGEPTLLRVGTKPRPDEPTETTTTTGTTTTTPKKPAKPTTTTTTTTPRP